MSPDGADGAWIAGFDQCKAAADESLDGLLKIAARGSGGSTEAFLTVLGAAAHLNAEGRAVLLAAAVTRLTYPRDQLEPDDQEGPT